jgi:hypothetical protein
MAAGTARPSCRIHSDGQELRMIWLHPPLACDARYGFFWAAYAVAAVLFLRWLIWGGGSKRPTDGEA